MTFDRARRRMVARNRQNVRLFLQQDRQRRVEVLDRLLLPLEIAVFAVHVCVFVMDEEEVVVLVLGEVTLELLVDGLWAFKLPHAHQLRQALVHGINCDASRLESVACLKER